MKKGLVVIGFIMAVTGSFSFALAQANVTLKTQAVASDDIGAASTFNIGTGLDGELNQVILDLGGTFTITWMELKVNDLTDGRITTNIRANLSGSGFVTWDFSSTTAPFQLYPDHNYDIVVYDRSGGSNADFMGVNAGSACYSGCSGTPFYVITGNPLGALSIGNATSSSLFTGLTATGTLEALAGQCSQLGNLFAEGLCSASAYLFLPSTDTINEWSDFASSTSQKFPFSWIIGVQHVFSTFSASSTANLATSTMDLSRMDFASSTAFGHILPSSFDFFGLGTVQKYMPAGFWAAMQTLIAAGLWLAFAADVFFTARNQMHRV